MRCRRPPYSSHLRPVALCLSLWLLATSAAAEQWTLAPGLTLPPLENFHISLQQPQVLDGQPVLVGYMGDEPAYFVAAEAADTSARPTQLWAALEKRLAHRNGSGRVAVVLDGTLREGVPQPVSYRAYRYSSNGKQKRQLYYLLPASSGYYWLYATAVERVELQALLPVTHTLARRAVQAQ